MAIDITTLKARLTEAEEAYHQQMVGAKEVSVSVGQFGTVTYNQVNRSALALYITNLKNQLADLEGKVSCKRKIMKVAF